MASPAADDASVNKPAHRRSSDTAPATLVTAWAALQAPLTALPPLVHSLLLWYALSRNGNVYMWLYELLGGSEEAVAFTLLAVFPFVTFLVLGLLYGAVDFTASVDFLHRYKLQRRFRPDVDDYIAATWIVLRNFVVITFPYAAVVAMYLMPLRRSRTGPTVPTLVDFLRDMAAFVVVEEVMFYYSHRLLHHPSIYAEVHKFHHTFTAPFAIAAAYAHPFEHFVSNIFPLTAGPLIMGSHPMSACIWSCVAVINTMSVHSGYAIPGMPPPHFHDWHHAKFKENYGVVGWLDFLHGTSSDFARHEFLRVTSTKGDDADSDDDDAADVVDEPVAGDGSGLVEKARGQAMPAWARGRFDEVNGADRARPHVIARRRVAFHSSELSPPASAASRASSGASSEKAAKQE